MTKILSIDGGGIRGLVPLCVLYVIEKRTGQPIYKLFDIISGTSTGAIIAGLLAAGAPVEQVMDFYAGKQAKKIFSKNLFKSIGFYCPQYDYKNIDEVLRTAFKGKTLKDCLTNLIIPADDWSNRQGRIFSTFEDRCKDVELWQIVRASSAAETYFKAYNDNNGSCYYDGGMYANNPADLAIVEAIKYKKAKLFDLVVVSLGTGTMVEKITPEDVENMWYYGILTNIIPQTMDRITSKTHDILSKIMTKEQYFRLQFDCPKEYEALDNVKDSNLKGLKNLADECITGIWQKDINIIVDVLKTLSISMLST